MIDFDTQFSIKCFEKSLEYKFYAKFLISDFFRKQVTIEDIKIMSIN